MQLQPTSTATMGRPAGTLPYPTPAFDVVRLSFINPDIVLACLLPCISHNPLVPLPSSKPCFNHPQHCSAILQIWLLAGTMKLSAAFSSASSASSKSALLNGMRSHSEWTGSLAKLAGMALLDPNATFLLAPTSGTNLPNPGINSVRLYLASR